MKSARNLLQFVNKPNTIGYCLIFSIIFLVYTCIFSAIFISCQTDECVNMVIIFAVVIMIILFFVIIIMLSMAFLRILKLSKHMADQTMTSISVQTDDIPINTETENSIKIETENTINIEIEYEN
jgi:ABC-type transport system involved in multi-copper enzyme maturation permease subunit